MIIITLSGNDAIKITRHKKKKKRFQININNMGLNIDKNEYYEIKLSNSAYPERGL